MIRRKSLGYLFIAVLVLGFVFLYFRRQAPGAGEDAAMQVHTFRTDAGWGYDILKDGKRYIHQEFIPALPGRRSFHSEEEARKVGQEVANRAMNGGLPAVTVEELKAWGIATDSPSLR